MIKIKSFLIYSSIVLVSSALNFYVFLEAYKSLAFPFIHEEQRVENAPYIFMYILPCFIFISILTLIVHKIVIKNRDINKDS